MKVRNCVWERGRERLHYAEVGTGMFEYVMDRGGMGSAGGLLSHRILGV